MISCAAIAIACRPEEQNRFTVTPGTETGKPANIAVRRATFNPCAPCGCAQPRITSSISPGSSCGVLRKTSFRQCAARSSGRVMLNDPRNDFASPVRELATTTASLILLSFSVTKHRQYIPTEEDFMAELVKITSHDEIAVITIDNPPVNALSPGVPEGIQAAVQSVASQSDVRAIVLIGAGQTFIAGADIREFGKIVSGERPRLSLLPYLQTIEDSPKPVIVAIHGAALGGGLETAMSGHYRVIAPTAQVGQPEVKLGLIPGAGGTQRLPRLAGVAKAVEMCASGEPIKAQEALAVGIADRIIEGDLLEGALAFAREVAGKLAPKTRERNEKLRDASPVIFSYARDEVKKRARGMTAPLAAIDAVEAATRLPFDEGCKREAELFNQCLYGPQSKALIHAFFGERTVAKIPGIPKDAKTYTIKRAAVIGAGTMGGGITMAYANAGIPVTVKETAQEALDRGLASIRKNYANTVSKVKLTQAEMDRRLALITP